MRDCQGRGGEGCPLSAGKKRRSGTVGGRAAIEGRFAATPRSRQHGSTRDAYDRVQGVKDSAESSLHPGTGTTMSGRPVAWDAVAPGLLCFATKCLACCALPP
jgi:hypothetical protein